MAQNITSMHGTPTSDKMTSLDHTSTISIYNKALMSLRRICSREPQITNILPRESIALDKMFYGLQKSLLVQAEQIWLGY